MDEPRRDGLAREFGAPVVQSGEEIGGDGFPRLDFHGVKGVGRGFDEGIDFVALLVAEKVEGRLDALIRLRLEEFGHDPIFEQGSTLGMGIDMGGSAHADEPSGQSEIAKVKLGRFDEAFVEVGEPRTDEEYEMAGLEDGKPGLGGDAGNASVRRERGDIE